MEQEMCPHCEGSGEVVVDFDHDPNVYENIMRDCGFCAGTGNIPVPSAENDSGYTELIDELNGRINGLERDNDALRYRLGEAVEAFTELLGVVAISKDVSQYDFNMARKALQQMIKSANK